MSFGLRPVTSFNTKRSDQENVPKSNAREGRHARKLVFRRMVGIKATDEINARYDSSRTPPGDFGTSRAKATVELLACGKAAVGLGLCHMHIRLRRRNCRDEMKSRSFERGCLRKGVTRYAQRRRLSKSTAAPLHQKPPDFLVGVTDAGYSRRPANVGAPKGATPLGKADINSDFRPASKPEFPVFPTGVNDARYTCAVVSAISPSNVLTTC